MKTIEDVKQFITDFIDWEYKVKRSGLHLVTTKEQYFKDASWWQGKNNDKSNS